MRLTANEDAMNHLSAKRRHSLPAEADFREELFARAGHCCEWCKNEPTAQQHEIARGASRQKARTCLFASLALGVDCHREIHRFAGDVAICVGLAILRCRRPEDFNLPKYWKLTARRWPELADVEAWGKRLCLNKE